MTKPLFEIGQIVQHKRFAYRGVVFDVDESFSLSAEWYDNMAQSRPPKDNPWYHVLVDGANHTTYVAERNLSRTSDVSQINHPMLGNYFTSYDGFRYQPLAQN